MKNKIAEIKELVKEVFPDLNQENDKDITPQLVRRYVRRKLPENILYETAVLIPSTGNCWIRIREIMQLLKNS
jgi:hypothetical protein